MAVKAAEPLDVAQSYVSGKVEVFVVFNLVLKRDRKVLEFCE